MAVFNQEQLIFLRNHYEAAAQRACGCEGREIDKTAAHWLPLFGKMEALAIEELKNEGIKFLSEIAATELALRRMEQRLNTKPGRD